MAEGYGGGKLKEERERPGMRDAPAWSTHFSNAVTMNTLVIDSPLRLGSHGLVTSLGPISRQLRPQHKNL